MDSEQMKKSKYPRIKFLKFFAVLICCSMILAIPTVMLTMDWSRNESWNFYGLITRIAHAHSPAIDGLDENGVPITNYGYQSGNYVGQQRNPLTIATKAISYYKEFSKTGKLDDRVYFLNCIGWLENSEIDKGNYSLWAYEFPDLTYNAIPPFYSAMAQARIMVAFESAYELTGDSHYLQLSIQAMRALEVPIEDGGTAYVDPEDGGRWYEEIAGGGSIPAHILNGFIFSLLDLDNFYVRTGSKEAKSLFDSGLIELKKHLTDYDTGYWTYYDRIGHFAYDYHYVHIDQMKQLYNITHDQVFKVFQDKWASYFPINPMWARERFAAYLFDFTLIFIGLVITTIVIQFYKQTNKIIKLRISQQTSHSDLINR